MMNKTYRSYSEITTIPDRLRWLRHSKGLMQWEAALIAGVSRSVYNSIECGTTIQMPEGVAESLSEFYGVPITDFLDEYNRFLYDGQAKRNKDYRKKLGLGRKPFCRQTGGAIIQPACMGEQRKEKQSEMLGDVFQGKGIIYEICLV